MGSKESNQTNKSGLIWVQILDYHQKALSGKELKNIQHFKRIVDTLSSLKVNEFYITTSYIGGIFHPFDAMMFGWSITCSEGSYPLYTSDKWQSKTLFLTIFDLHLSVILAFWIAAFQV